MITATELGLYRVIFGLCLYWVFESLRATPAAIPRELHLSNARLADWAWVHWLASDAQATVFLEHLVIATLAIFILGLASRPVYWLLAAELLVWTLVRLQRTGTHSWMVGLVTVMGLLPIRWGDGFSVDQMVRRWWGRGLRVEPRGRGYGFALWLPGLVFGTAMAGAGIAKLRGSGLEWMLGGAVKYHFVVDSQNAPVNWGLWIASHHWAAVAMSCLAVTVELGLSLGPWLRTYTARLPLALAGLGLLVGFHLFQNERWLAWWMVWGLFYVPWPRLFRLCRRAIPAHLVFIDGECARCCRTARLLTGLDLFNRLRFIPLQRRVVWRCCGETVREDELLPSMHVVCLGRHRLVRGYRAYFHLGQSLPICWPLLPIASLLLVGNIGERVYAHLAKSRTRRLGELCPLQSAVRPRGASLGWAAAIVTFTVCLLQVIASVAEVEVEPIMSSYPMYSNTYQSTNDFDRRVSLHLSYSFAATVNGQEEDVTDLFDRLGVDEVFRDALLRLAETGRLDDDARARVKAAVSLFESRTGRNVTQVWLKTDEQAFDWHRGVFYQKLKGAVVGMLDVRSLQGT